MKSQAAGEMMRAASIVLTEEESQGIEVADMVSAVSRKKAWSW